MENFNSDGINKSFEEANKSELKAWNAPKLVIEDTENTKGGTHSNPNTGDDAWYSS